MEAHDPELHHQPSLVEGDFFPLIEVGSVDGETTEVLLPSVSQGISAAHPPNKVKKRKISWADDKTSGDLFAAIAEFYLPNTTRAVSLAAPAARAAAAAAPPTSIVRERTNGDGLQYHFYPSQRPSQRLLDARITAKRGGEIPFTLQPGLPETSSTLFSSMFAKKPAISVEGRKRIAVVQLGLPLAPALGSGSPDSVLEIFSP